MSALLDLQMEIQRTNEAVARAERAVAQYPHLISALATLRGFVKLRNRLQEEAAAVVTCRNDSQQAEEDARC